MTPKLWGYLGVGVGVLALIAAVIWQMNVAVKRGIELGEARATIEDLRGKLKEKRDADRAEWDKLRADIINCEERVTAATTIGDEWKAKWDTIRRRPPRTVTVEVESETWHESLVEGHAKLLAGLERIRAYEDTPYPPG